MDMTMRALPKVGDRIHAETLDGYSVSLVLDRHNSANCWTARDLDGDLWYVNYDLHENAFDLVD